MKQISVNGYHDFSCAHRAYNDPGKCQRIHGHNYRVTLHINGHPDRATGRVVDFDVMKRQMFAWLESHWDHKWLVCIHDPIMKDFAATQEVPKAAQSALSLLLAESIVPVPFDPSTENIADYLLEIFNTRMLSGTGAILYRVEVSETRKFGATAEYID